MKVSEGEQLRGYTSRWVPPTIARLSADYSSELESGHLWTRLISNRSRPISLRSSESERFVKETSQVAKGQMRSKGASNENSQRSNFTPWSSFTEAFRLRIYINILKIDWDNRNPHFHLLKIFLLKTSSLLGPQWEVRRLFENDALNWFGLLESCIMQLASQCSQSFSGHSIEFFHLESPVYIVSEKVLR